MAKKRETCVVLELGYNKYILPDGVDVEALRSILGMRECHNQYCTAKNGKQSRNVSYIGNKQEVSIRIISADSIESIVDNLPSDKEGGYGPIISAVTAELRGKKHATIVFSEGKYSVGGKKFDYKSIPNDDDDSAKAVIKEEIDNIVERALDPEVLDCYDS
jgi:hypothetical protein